MKFAVWGRAGVAGLLLCLQAAQADTVLWYNGDFDGRNALSNEINTDVSASRVYDDFVVTGPGWTIDRIWSNNLMSFVGVTQADWSIRSGVSTGNGGTVVASGTSSATQTATGRSGFGLTEYTIEVAGLAIDLAPGTYWLQVSPIGGGSGRSFESTTSGANSVGTPAGHNGDAFFDSAFFGASFSSADDWVPVPGDFSMGVAGALVSEVPEPTSLVLLGLPLLGMVLRESRRRC